MSSLCSQNCANIKAARMVDVKRPILIPSIMVTCRSPLLCANAALEHACCLHVAEDALCLGGVGNFASDHASPKSQAQMLARIAVLIVVGSATTKRDSPNPGILPRNPGNLSATMQKTMSVCICTSCNEHAFFGRVSMIMPAHIPAHQTKLTLGSCRRMVR